MQSEPMIDLVVPSEWNRIDAVRSVTDHVMHAVARVAPTEFARSLGMVASELMENAVKYGKEGEDVSFRMQQQGPSMLISVTNMSDPTRSPPSRLHARVAWLASFETALEAYRASIGKLDEDDTVGGAGLGLARILFEGECTLHCQLHDDGRVSMEARHVWDSQPEPNPQ